MAYELTMQKYLLRAGVGVSEDKLTAFDRALIGAGIAQYNLVKISSILPPVCSQQSEITLSKGSLLPTAFSVIYTSNLGDVLSAAVAIGIPEDQNEIGVIMEHSSLTRKDITEKKVRALAVQAMNDRKIAVKEIVSIGTECKVASNEIYCAFASASIW